MFLRDYQIEAIRFMQQQSRCALWLPMGLGKTLITLSAVNDQRLQFLPALIVGPKRVVRHVWRDEIQKWGFDFSVAIVDGTPKQKRKAVESGADVTCISADSLKYAVDGPWMSLICDEATLFKSHKSARSKLAKRIADCAARVVELTGSPTSGAGLIDLWGQMDLLFPKQDCPLGNYWQFTQRFFYFDHFNRAHAKKGAEKQVADLISPWVFRRDLSEIVMPGLHTQDIIVDCDASQHEAMTHAELEEDGTFAAMRTISSGFLYQQHWSGDQQTEWISDGKIDALTEIRHEVDEPLLVLCNFRAEVDRIAKLFGAAVLDGRTPAKEADILIRGWNEGSLPMLVANCQAMSHGLNLQAGGHHIVWFSLPVSQDTYDQAVARLWRSGQQNAVFVSRLVCEGSIDQKIAKLLDRKMLSQAALMDAVRITQG